MKRRDFLKKAGIASAGAFVAPHIISSSNKIWASSSAAPLAKHVVLVMFAGGVRHQDSVGHGYLRQSQYDYVDAAVKPETNFEGNIMNNMLEGAAPLSAASGGKIIYGTKASSYIDPLPLQLSNSIQKQGVLFKEAVSSNPGHYGGLNVMLQGDSAEAQGLKNRPAKPTIFEYLRKISPEEFPASKVWFIGNTVANSIPLLIHSQHPDYGASYGANFFAPGTTFGAKGDQYLADAKLYHPEEQLDPMYQMKYFLDNNFSSIGNSLPNIGNTEEEKQMIKAYMKGVFDGTIDIQHPSSLSPADRNGDINTISHACSILEHFQPKVLVVNLSSVDTAHGNFTGSMRNLHRADAAVGHLWNFINSSPALAGSSLKNDTVMLIAPECGRNAAPNAIKDPSSLFGYDHSDSNTRRVFMQMVTNKTALQSSHIPTNTVYNYTNAALNDPGQLAPKSAPGTGDVALTIAEIFGYKQAILDGGLTRYKESLFDKM